MPPAWLMLSCQSVTPNAVAAFAAPPESRTSGAAPGARWIITSVEGDPRPEAGADRLEYRFLGGEPPRQALNAIDPIADLIQLGLHEATRNQRVARILYPPPHLADVH